MRWKIRRMRIRRPLRCTGKRWPMSCRWRRRRYSRCGRPPRRKRPTGWEWSTKPFSAMVPMSSGWQTVEQCAGEGYDGLLLEPRRRGIFVWIPHGTYGDKYPNLKIATFDTFSARMTRGTA